MATDSGPLFYVGPGPDALDVVPGDGTSYRFERDGEGVKVDNPDIYKNLLAREDFQTSKPTRQKPKVETPEGKE